MFARQAVDRASAQEQRDRAQRLIIEQQWQAFCVKRSLVIENLVDEEPLPRYATAAVERLLAAFEAVAIRRRTHDQEPVGGLDLPLHPAGPTVGRRCLEAIEPRVNTQRAQVLHELEHTIGMARRIVAVADEHADGHTTVNTTTDRRQQLETDTVSPVPAA